MDKFQIQLDRIEKLLLLNKNILNFQEACLYTGIKESYMYKLTSGNVIPHSKPNGKLIFFEKTDIDSWCLKNKTLPEEAYEAEALKYVLSKS
ncbi:helix-turn-helix domain-containing protein [Aquimarina algiphila]|uniref:Helix-turn-helix domain-containing protein n=1 Tax=Aquimarina algiphila TaxID=2047982 RepID=A0A554VIR5_9FLAO|nr:helix-turn-helix domain-containing protein [Aquimarina algiphila]TSE07724.1 helix-turn-helix domain-containing protein [Aquimarina algiphila]